MRSIADILVNENKQCTIEYCLEKESFFYELLNLALDQYDPLNWRACSVLSDVIQENDTRLISRLDDIMHLIPHVNHSHQRELLKLVLKMDISDDQNSALVEIAFSLWRNIHKQSSVRYYAFKCMLKVAAIHPELKNEILLYSGDYFMDTLSQGIRRSIVKMLKKEFR